MWVVLPARTGSARSWVGLGPALQVACARVSSGGAGVYAVGRVPGWGGASASGCLRPGAVWWGRRVRGRSCPWLVWGPALQVACALGPFGVAGVSVVGGVPGWGGASASGCLRPGVVWQGRRLRGRRGPRLGWGQCLRLPAPGCRLGFPACTGLAGSRVGVGPALPVACARVSSGGAGVYGVSRAAGGRGSSASAHSPLSPLLPSPLSPPPPWVLLLHPAARQPSQ